MAVKIRLRQQGRTNCAHYRLVAMDSKSPRDGRYVEMLGWYNPHQAELEKSISVREDRIHHWLEQGAVMTPKAEALIARVAPNVIKKIKEKELAKRAHCKAKRDARKKAKA